jgi:hypothetical protein
MGLDDGNMFSKPLSKKNMVNNIQVLKKEHGLV